ncbi:MAG: hypothetical protein CMI60_07985 [Parvibaculum sp.]|nr:hypothetical protein [Parvibaculum sp.]
MITSRVRSALLSTAVGVGLVAASTTANALEYNFGGVQVFFDTTVSAGVSMRVVETNKLFLAAGNGGPSKNTAFVVTPGTATGVTAFGGGQAVTLDAAPTLPNGGLASDAFAGSINGDDGRLNFDQWDLTSGIVKMTNDIQANYENYKFFARVNSFYDAVLDSSSSYARSGIQDGARVDVARDIDLLDFYVSGDFNVGDLPLNVRLGKQVVNWGEATFILNGISSWNPFDVNAFRRPGAEIREGLLPVWGAYASLGLPYDLSLEAFYQLEYQELKLDRPGTPFSVSDVARVGSGPGGNVGGASWVTGGTSGGGFLNRNCSTPDALTGALNAAYAGAGLTQFVCPGAGGTNPFVDYSVDLPIGQSEANRLALNGGTPDILRLVDREAKDTGQYGLALRWYAEDLNSTEFGFYFMNYHSRLPLVSQRLSVGLNGDPNTSYRSYSAVGANAGTTARTSALACGTDAFANGGATVANAGELTAALNPAKLAYLNSVVPLDQYGVFAAAEALVGGDAKALAGAGVVAAAGGAITDNSLLENMILNCALAFSQTDAGASLLTDGTELVVNGPAVGGIPSIGLYLEYPEDIQLYGVSFNTTVGDWGVQGEVAFRQDQPFQLDTDQITIATLGASCIFDGILGSDAVTAAVDAAQTLPNSSCGSVAQGTSRDYQGFVREEVVNFDIGTTATYTNSNQIVGALGADIGILLTELGAMYVPDAPDEGDFSVAQWGNVCTSGTDLPLKSFLVLSTRNGCRPTQFSYGYVLVGILQYNNAFGTPITLSPQIAWSHDVKGNSPAPMSNFREGRKRVSLAVNGSYQNTWRGGISYVNNFGNEKYNNVGDQDFVSINLSYSF